MDRKIQTNTIEEYVFRDSKQQFQVRLDHRRSIATLLSGGPGTGKTTLAKVLNELEVNDMDVLEINALTKTT